MTANTHRRSVTPAAEKPTVASDVARRRPNAALRSREHVTPDAVERLIAAAKQGRWGHRDATLLLIAYRHGLRASELTDLRWDQIDFSAANFHVRRAKKGTPATHPSWATSCARYAACSVSKPSSRPSSCAAAHSRPLGSRGSSRLPPGELVWRSKPTLTCCATPAVTSLPTMATTPGRCRPISAIKNIQHTVRYTELSPTRFKGFCVCWWRRRIWQHSHRWQRG
jgi:Phage integrase family